MTKENSPMGKVLWYDGEFYHSHTVNNETYSLFVQVRRKSCNYNMSQKSSIRMALLFLCSGGRFFPSGNHKTSRSPHDFEKCRCVLKKLLRPDDGKRFFVPLSAIRHCCGDSVGFSVDPLLIHDGGGGRWAA